VLQCVAVCCSVLQCTAVCCSVLQCVAVYCSVLQWVAVRCSVLRMRVLCHFTGFARLVWVTSKCLQHTATHCNTLQHTTSKCLPTTCRRPIAYLIFIHHCPQKSPINSGSFVETDLQLKASYGLPPPYSVLIQSHLYISFLGLFCKRDL